MEFVDAVPFNDMGTAEIGSYIFQDKLYVACRQDYSIPYLYLGALNLKTMKWDKHYKLADGNARPWFFEYKDESNQNQKNQNDLNDGDSVLFLQKSAKITHVRHLLSKCCARSRIHFSFALCHKVFGIPRGEKPRLIRSDQMRLM
jgi:hypothetical protein